MPGFKQSSEHVAGLQAQHERAIGAASTARKPHAMCASAMPRSLCIPVGLVRKSALSPVDTVAAEVGGS